MKTYRCTLCSYYGKMKVKSKIDSRKILSCPSCKFQFMYPKPTSEEIKNIYGRDYFGAWGIGDGETKEVANMKKKTFKNILKGIIPYKNKGNILDVGCATGFLLEEASEIGFNPYGIEISEYASSIAKNKFGEKRIYTGTLENHNFDEDSFDVITMCDCIEHVEDPISVLTLSNQLLKNTLNSNGGGGYMLITTPNTDSFSAMILRSKWHRYMLEHLTYFNKRSMKKICEMTGFEIIKSFPCVKIVNLNFLYTIAKYYKQFIISDIISLLHRINLINKIDFPVLMGEVTYILKKTDNIKNTGGF